MRFLLGIRVAGLLTGALLGYALLPSASSGSGPGPLAAAIWLAAWTLVGFSLPPYLAVVPTRVISREFAALSGGQMAVTALAGLCGALLGLVLGLPLGNLPGVAGIFVTLLVNLCFGAGMAGLALTRSADLLQALGRPVSLRAKRSPAATGGLVLDTSALIDGRIIEIIRLGLTDGRIAVSRASVDELRMLADDPARHDRGVRGQEMLMALRAMPRIRLEVPATSRASGRDADARILTLAATREAVLVTTDAALERAAVGAGVAVVNVHILADALLAVVSPGDRRRVHLTELGREPGQAIGHLPDGALLIVEGAADLVGEDVEVTISRFARTSGGRIVFARPSAPARR